MKIILLLFTLLCAKNLSVKGAVVPLVDCPCMQSTTTTVAPLNQTMIEQCNIYNFLNDNGYKVLLNQAINFGSICSQYSVSTVYTLCLRTTVKQCFINAKFNNDD